MPSNGFYATVYSFLQNLEIRDSKMVKEKEELMKQCEQAIQVLNRTSELLKQN